MRSVFSTERLPEDTDRANSATSNNVWFGMKVVFSTHFDASPLEPSYIVVRGQRKRDTRHTTQPTIATSGVLPGTSPSCIIRYFVAKI